MIFKKLSKELEIIEITEAEFKQQKADYEVMFGGSYIMLIGGNGLMLLPYEQIRKSTIINFYPIQSIIDDAMRKNEADK